MKLKIALGAMAAGLLLLASACASDSATTVAPPRVIPQAIASPSAVQVQAQDYRFTLAQTHLKAGKQEFLVRNDGTVRHEFVIVPVEGERYKLPLGEIEAFAPGETRAIRAELEPGRYEFVCLLALVSPPDDSGAEATTTSHMALGMRLPIEVEQ